MLSAIAARKARLQQPNILRSENNSENNSQLTPPPKISTKRRHGHQATINLSVKKPRKNPSSGHSGVSNLLNRFTPQDDVIILENSDDDSDMSTSLDQDNPASALVRPEPSTVPVRRAEMKAWSPSRPVVDSSDDASDTSEQPSTDFFSSYNRPLTSEEPEVLSTYHPIHEQNIFRLSLNEGSALGLNGPALALVLSPLATVSFVGTYRLRVLRGSISILGTTVVASHVLHPVFAPRSSPVPVIQALVACGESSTSLPDIPARMLDVVDDGDVVILLQELRTGIEGIGHVMRTFEGAFDHVNLEGPSDIPLEGIHLVCRFPIKEFLFSLEEVPR
jgi:polynucleotide 5'-hydroxyl-kinase GRC3/NOL9